MHHPIPRWSTAAYSDAADTTPADLESLSAHMACCNAPSSGVERLGRASRWAGGVMRVRLVSCLVAAVLLWVVLALVA